MKKTFKQRVIDIVSAIPEGEVMTFTEVATAAGKDRHSAQAVGLIIKHLTDPKVPVHRVVTVDGGLGRIGRMGSVFTKKKAEKLAREGVPFFVAPRRRWASTQRGVLMVDIARIRAKKRIRRTV